MRLVTRPDLDGLTCAVLLSQCETVDSFEFVHPQQVRDREVEIGKDDILVNVPYHPSSSSSTCRITRRAGCGSTTTS